MAIGLALKGVASLFPKNTIVNKLANNPTGIKASDIKNAINDVKGSVSGTRGILGGSTPAINLLAKAGVKTTSEPNAEQGGLATLTPSTFAYTSALASQASVSKSLSAGAMGQSSPTTPMYADQFNATNDKGIIGDTTLTIPPVVMIGALVAGYFLLTNKR